MIIAPVQPRQALSEYLRVLVSIDIEVMATTRVDPDGNVEILNASITSEDGTPTVVMADSGSVADNDIDGYIIEAIRKQAWKQRFEEDF